MKHHIERAYAPQRLVSWERSASRVGCSAVIAVVSALVVMAAAAALLVLLLAY